MYQIGNLAQITETAVEAPVVVTTSQEIDEYGVIGTVWKEIYQYCENRLPPETCRALLGYKPVYFPPEIKSNRWYLWIGLGYALGRFL